jgi:hypothetical protein
MFFATTIGKMELSAALDLNAAIASSAPENASDSKEGNNEEEVEEKVTITIAPDNDATKSAVLSTLIIKNGNEAESLHSTTISQYDEEQQLLVRCM